MCKSHFSLFTLLFHYKQRGDLPNGQLPFQKTVNLGPSFSNKCLILREGMRVLWSFTVLGLQRGKQTYFECLMCDMHFLKFLPVILTMVRWPHFMEKKVSALSRVFSSVSEYLFDFSSVRAVVKYCGQCRIVKMPTIENRLYWALS